MFLSPFAATVRREKTKYIGINPDRQAIFIWSNSAPWKHLAALNHTPNTRNGGTWPALRMKTSAFAMIAHPTTRPR
jgi:hypothetical protein